MPNHYTGHLRAVVGGVGYLKNTKRFRFPFVKEIFDLHGNNLVNSRLNLKNDLLDFVYFYCGGFCAVILFLLLSSCGTGWCNLTQNFLLHIFLLTQLKYSFKNPVHK